MVTGQALMSLESQEYPSGNIIKIITLRHLRNPDFKGQGMSYTHLSTKKWYSHAPVFGRCTCPTRCWNKITRKYATAAKKLLFSYFGPGLSSYFIFMFLNTSAVTSLINLGLIPTFASCVIHRPLAFAGIISV